VLTRFAPSPTGYLHLGHAYAAQQAFEYGPCLLRIEDIDTTRCKPEFTRAIYEDLDWLGFDWPVPVRVQSRHLEAYSEVVKALDAKGLAYRCFKTRKEVQALSIASDDGTQLYRRSAASLDTDGESKKLAAGEPFAWRLSIERCQDYLGEKFGQLRFIETGSGEAIERPARIERYSDEIIARKDIGTAYHVAVTHDDNLQNISHIVRGADLEGVTGFHVLLQALMDWPTPIYHHHGLVRRGDGEKLSKRYADTTIRSWRESGRTAKDLLNLVKDAAS